MSLFDKLTIHKCAVPYTAFGTPATQGIEEAWKNAETTNDGKVPFSYIIRVFPEIIDELSISVMENDRYVGHCHTTSLDRRLEIEDKCAKLLEDSTCSSYIISWATIYQNMSHNEKILILSMLEILGIDRDNIVASAGLAITSDWRYNVTGLNLSEHLIRERNNLLITKGKQIVFVTCSIASSARAFETCGFVEIKKLRASQEILGENFTGKYFTTWICGLTPEIHQKLVDFLNTL